MVTRIDTIQWNQDYLEEEISPDWEKVMSEARKMARFGGGYILVDRESGKFESIRWNPAFCSR